MTAEKIDSKPKKFSLSSIVRGYSTCSYHIGCCIGTYPRWFSISTVIVYLLLGCGLYNFGEINDISSQFTPRNSPSRREEQLAREFLSSKDGEKIVGTSVFIRSKTGESVLDSDHLGELLQVVLQFENGGMVADEDPPYSYEAICGPHCRGNYALITVLKIYDAAANRNLSSVQVTYPTLHAVGMHIYIGRSFYGVQTDEESVMMSADMVALTYQATVRDELSQNAFHKWEKQLYKAADDVNKNSSLLRITYLDPLLIPQEIRRTGLSALPFFSLSFTMVALFTVLSTLRSRVSDCCIRATLMGVIGPVLALLASNGVLIGIGIAYQPIVVVSYFLIMAIGVDDVFIILRGWSITADEADAAVRLGKTMRWSAPSITITSLTNGLSFAVGIFCNTPAIQTFCTFSALAVLFTFFVQITLFSPLLVITLGRYVHYPLADTLLHALTDSISSCYHRFIKFYTSFLTSKLTALLTVAMLVAYWLISLYGWSKLNVDLNTDKLLLADSPVLELREIEKKYLEGGSGLISVLVFAPGDLRDESILRKTQQIVVDFETCDPLQEGAESTFMWLRPYLEHLSFEQEADPPLFSYASIPSFLLMESSAVWQVSLKTNDEMCALDDPRCIEAYAFTTNFRNATSWADKVRLLSKWREIANTYAQFNVSTFYAANFICDQVSSVTSLTSSSIIATIICMFFVCCIFIPHPMSIGCAMGCLLSINLGVIGFLALWDIDLDPIALAALLIAVGFSVDFTGHMSFHFHGTSKFLKTVVITNGVNKLAGSLMLDQAVEEKVEHSLDAVLWPMLQAGLSTLLCTCVLALHQSYLTMIFVKKVVIVVGLGFWHGAFILPVLLANFSRIGEAICRRRTQASA